MRKIVLLFLLFVIGTIAFSQEITVRFTGQLNGTDYCRLDSVKVTNLTRNWTETVEYPDTIIVLGGTVGTNLNVAATQGLGQNIPNPFDCETRVELSVSQRENVRMQLLDASGKQYADYRGSLDAGVHTFDISAAAPQTYILNAVVGDKSYSIRMVNMGSGCGSSIKYAGISGSITAKLTTANEFQNGDNMRYVGYMTIYGDIVASTAVEQSQTESEDITLNFAHCINTFGTDIQSACYSYTWIDGVTYTESTTEPTFTLTNAAGCDSVVTLQLTINHSNTGIDEQTACESYIWIDGITYTESTNEPTFTLTNAVGCDSVVTLHLTINHSNTGIDEQTACDSYTWIDGVTYTTSTNEPTFTLTNVAGCDSVVTLHLTMVCPPTVQTDAATGISSTGVTLNGNVISDGGATVTARGFLYGTNSSDLTQTVQSGSGTGSFMAYLTGLTSGTTYYYKAYATNSEGTAYGEVMSFTTISYSEPTGYVNGYGYVDLGLPSGARWATCNVGADIPEGYGNYYAWGETTTKETYSWTTYIYAEGTSNNDPKLTKYCYNATYGNDGFTDEYTILLTEDDAATANWGAGWRMPMSTEIEELYNNCTLVWTTQNGVNGCLFTGPNGNSIFLPAAGVSGPSGLQEAGTNGKYYSSSLGTSSSRGARSLNISSDEPGFGNTYRNWGLSVRPVCASAPIVNTNVATNITLDGATLSGSIISNGATTVTARGFYWGISEDNLVNNAVYDGTANNFSVNLTGLARNSTYYYCAYATNSTSTAIGNIRSFTTKCVCGIDVVTDIDGNQYATVLIGEQCWMAENLKTTRFADGTSIPLGSDTETSNTTAYRWNPGNNSNNVSAYGYLYNWPAAMHGASSTEANPSGVQGVCPTGWHLPSYAEWIQLRDYLYSHSQYGCGGNSDYYAKSLASTTGWNSSTTTCTPGYNQSNNNSSGFGARPAGYYYGETQYQTGYYELGKRADFYTATEETDPSFGANNAKYFSIGHETRHFTSTFGEMYRGRSVRCVRDE